MRTLAQRLTPFLFLFLAFSLIEAGITADYADARSRSGGRSFRRSAPKRVTPAPSRVNKQQTGNKSGFGRGLAGGLLGGALGGMLFGSMFGMGGSGMGILPLLLLGVVGYMFYKKFKQRPSDSSAPGFRPPPSQGSGSFPGFGQTADTPPPVPPIQEQTLDDGLAQIRQTDPGFDEAHFTEVASDVFFKVQAGWMRRDLSAYKHLLGDTLAAEYDKHFADMKAKGEINKLESIAIRKVEIVDAGSDGREDFITVLFTANLLDYTVDEKSGAVKSGSDTEPVKFAERWTWARPTGTENWKLEGIEEDT